VALSYEIDEERGPRERPECELFFDVMMMHDMMLERILPEC
jgi:hypothetical protein